ncbi:FAD-dependent oxidoreductase [Marinithermus hydrothermalis]|uniref:FAD dependent oxidoreductase n=1 Tax=Marinithermus hydrothermalis (strain DSM 14884 / JCM 11576 / T1) TaxID=869210 RepID=F2NMJ5_MARHT|nr:FAD-dependent oxidoreductase [Marinithermus hydrothermalis]AEB12165.1 FAD dependent oxidoreductase [Marinithermus hydrothermalis DSM 14884]
MADAIVVGAGIAGLAAADALQRKGLRVTVVSPTLGEASRVPVALVNPVRGRRGAIAPEAETALEAAWRFYPRFVPVHPGLRRPVPPEAQARWDARLRERAVAYRWEGSTLYLPEAFWLEPRALLARLAAGLEVIRDRVVAGAAGRVRLASGRELAAPLIVYTTGASGAALTGLGGRFTAGSLLLTHQRFPEARSWGVFAAGCALGGSYRPHTDRYAPHTPTHGEVAWILAQAEALLGFRPTPVGVWGGVRYRLDGLHLREIPGKGWALTGFGSTGFLYAPLWAERLAARL